MNLILILGNVGRLQSRDTLFRRNLKCSTIKRRLLLPKIANLSGQISVPSRWRTEQPAKIDIELFKRAAHPAFGKRHEFIDRIKRNLFAANAHVGVE